MEEIWKDIKDYEKLYQGSNLGRIRSLKFGKMRILKPQKVKGYLRVCLCKDRKYKWFNVHRLVWITFNGKIPEGYEINHIDENTLNNRLDNLNLLTHKANLNWGTRNQRIKEKHLQAVLQLTLDDELVKEWPSIAEAGRNGFNQGCISLCCNGKQKYHKGFKWVKKKTYSV